MEKKSYSKPMMRTEKFVPNAYCKVCYKVQCKTDANNSSGWKYIYEDTNGNGELDESDKLLYGSGYSSFSGCGSWQGTFSETAPTYNGFITNYKYGENSSDNHGGGNNGGGTSNQKIQRVYVWYEQIRGYYDYHVCYDPTNTQVVQNSNASL